MGGGETLHVDVRVVAATNVHLPDLAASGKFRPDLLDRLAFDVITVPPLRARLPDIPVLADHFATRMASELGRPLFAGFSTRALDALAAHDWPGNVQRVAQRGRAQRLPHDRPGETGVRNHFSTRSRRPTRRAKPFRPRRRRCGRSRNPLWPPHRSRPAAILRRQRAAYEARLLQQALEACRFNQAEAARQLGLSYYQFRHHLRVHGMLAEAKKRRRR